MSAILIHQIHSDGFYRWISIGVRNIASTVVSICISITPINNVLSHSIITRISNRTQIQGVSRIFLYRDGSTQSNSGGYVVDGDHLGTGAAAAIFVTDGDLDRAVSGVDQTIFIITEEMLYIATERQQFGCTQELWGTAISPVDAVAETVI